MKYPNILRNLLHFRRDDEELELFVRVVIEEEQRIQCERMKRRRGSRIGRTIINRNREEGETRLFHDYFSDNCVFKPQNFRRRFRMRRSLFCKIQHAVVAHNNYFLQKRDALGKLGLSSLQKVAAALRMLTYGAPADSLDEYLQIAESTIIESLKHFIEAIVEVFGDKYLRPPNNNDIARLLLQNEARGFPGMLGSIGCMHWTWKNCPTAWQGMYTGHCPEPTIILEAVASHDLWIWHAFFGLPGSMNDINVLHRSPIFDTLAEGRAPNVNYTINGNDYTMGYYLVDGIYPTWATLVKTISAPQGLNKQHFAKAQESARKDVERAFGVLQARFAIVRGPARIWQEKVLANIMKACIIMHNMIIEDEGAMGGIDFEGGEVSPHAIPEHTYQQSLSEFIEGHHRIRDKETHWQLQSDLVEHLWSLHGNE